MKKTWLIAYHHTCCGDEFEGTYEEAKNFAIETLQKELAGIVFPVTVNNCGDKIICNCYEDFIEVIEEYEYNEEEIE